MRSNSPDLPLTPEERDARTIFCMQLSQRVRARDVEDFFSSVGKVRDVKLIVCNKTRRFKGISYVEFKDLESVPLALGLSGELSCVCLTIVMMMFSHLQDKSCWEFLSWSSPARPRRTELAITPTP